MIEAQNVENNESNASEDKKREHAEEDLSEKTLIDSNKKPDPIPKPKSESPKLSQNQQNKLKKKLMKEKAALNDSKESVDEEFDWIGLNDKLDSVDAQNKSKNMKAGAFKRVASPKTDENVEKKAKQKH